MAPFPKATDSRATDRLRALNSLPAEHAFDRLLSCCGSQRWARRMVGLRPFADETALFASAADVWNALGAEDWLEAFRAHPRIGDRMERAGEAEPAPRAGRWSAAEQSGASAAGVDEREDLRSLNDEYERRFGRTFIVCATGKSAGEMLALLQARMGNDPETELQMAAAEQQAITAIRLRKLLHDNE